MARRRCGEPGAALHLAVGRAPALDSSAPTSSRRTASSRPATCSTSALAWCPEVKAHAAARCSTRSSRSSPTRRTTSPGRVFGELSYRSQRPRSRLGRAALRPRRAREHDRDAGGVHSGTHCVGHRVSRARCARRPGTTCSRRSTLRFKPNDDSRCSTSGYSRGFRSGGFNQTGVGAAGIAGIDDLFDQETADTYEAGVKAQFADRRLSTSAERLSHQGEGHVLLRVRSEHEHAEPRQPRRGRVPGARARDRRRQSTDGLDLYLRGGYTDSEIKESRARSERRRQPGAARLRVHDQPRRAVAASVSAGD